MKGGTLCTPKIPYKIVVIFIYNLIDSYPNFTKKKKKNFNFSHYALIDPCYFATACLNAVSFGNYY
jgi:hypothetical protein